MTSKLDRKRAAATVPQADRQAPSHYRDDPDAVSLHTTRSDYDYDDVPELPSYVESAAADATVTTSNAALAIPPDWYRSIAQPTINRGNRNASSSQAVSIGCETSVRMEERLMDATALHEYITHYIRKLPPRPMVRIQGWHWQNRQRTNKKKEKERVFDFDIVLSLQPFLQPGSNSDWWSSYTVDNSDKAHRGSFRQTRAKGYKHDIEVGEDPKPDLEAWCREFCESSSWLKVFRISRNVAGLEIEQIKTQLETLVKSTHYRGHIDITFPIVDKNVDIYSPHWMNQARITWVRWLFYLTFLWLITWPILFFMTKRWSVYNVQWRWSQQEGAVKRYATISEGDWLKRHANLIQSLVMDKYHGDATELPTDVSVDTERRRSEIRVPQVRVGGGGIGAAVSLLQGGVSVWNQANGRGDAGWGADEC
ncbi:hypothetical protein Slin15195_G041720 [Septoria linicola]|uniref:Uncharacterized protein n=1 Tax=Septoria linicola TaxID=215465 RepID=A0A9Q9EJ00_9PEZI|nr:hypothetical protein Slin14017_G045230 [Septoria linicola]USW50853.1 hypothetical protein Slin15195_G041720 [Septoria linicola]